MNVCPLCYKSYKRPEHLRRHLISHSTDQPYVCSNCTSSFQRSDVLRRHQQVCGHVTAQEAGDAQPPAKRVLLSPPSSLTTPGNREVAVSSDEVSFYDTGQPFSGEAAAENDPFVHIEHGLDDTADFWYDFLNQESIDDAEAIPDEANTKPARFLGFLSNFTSDSGLIHSFDCGTREQRQAVATATALESNQAASTEAQWLPDPLSFKSHEIIASIQDIVTHKPRQSSITISWSPMVFEACTQFFSAANIRHYLSLYWALWHPNVNIMHKPTFDAPSAKAYLLAAMCLIGACVSPDPTDVVAARQWFNCVEETVFTSDDFCNDSQAPVDRDTGQVQWRHEKLRALQAAYMVLLYQNWEGSDSSKRRVRRLRFSMLVAAVRDVDIHNARQVQVHNVNFADFSFPRFAITEELIRVVLWVFLVDTAFVIFNNLPPRMTIREMEMDFASPESCFQATAAEDCFRALKRECIQKSSAAKQPLQFAAAFELLYQNPLPDATTMLLADLGPLNLFALTSTLHSLVFHYQNTFSGHSGLQCVQDALNGWRHVWQAYTIRFSHDERHVPLLPDTGGATTESPTTAIQPQDMWRRLGFMRHAEEYWLLAKLMVDSLVRRQSRGSAAEAAGRGGPAGKDNGAVGAASSPDDNNDDNSTTDSHAAGPLLLRHYDETSMQQVNELIADLQKFGI